MKQRFEVGQIVRETDHGGRSDMNGLIGVVVRVKAQGDSAWIRSYIPLSEKQRKFPAGDDRQDHFDIYSDECELVGSPSASRT